MCSIHLTLQIKQFWLFKITTIKKIVNKIIKQNWKKEKQEYLKGIFENNSGKTSFNFVS